MPACQPGGGVLMATSHLTSHGEENLYRMWLLFRSHIYSRQELASGPRCTACRRAMARCTAVVGEGILLGLFAADSIPRVKCGHPPWPEYLLDQPAFRERCGRKKTPRRRATEAGRPRLAVRA